MTVLEGKKLTKLYRKHNKTIEALKDVDFYLEKGEILGLAEQIIREPREDYTRRLAGSVPELQGTVPM